MKRIVSQRHLSNLYANVRSLHRPQIPHSTIRFSSNTTHPPTIEEVLSKPSWSVSSLLHSHESSTPSASTTTTSTSTSTSSPTSSSSSPPSPPTTESNSTNTIITPSTLRNLLRLSALPYPETKEKEDKLLASLQAQINFVREVQNVDTRGVRPLRSVRDESEEAERENEITTDSLKDAFAREKVVGKHYKRIRRGGGGDDDAALIDGGGGIDGKAAAAGEWDVFAGAVRRKGNYFVVDHGDEKGERVGREA